MSLGIMAGRAAGFVRESSIAAVNGAGEKADIAVLMLTVPDFLVNVLMGGALSVALIPELKALGEKAANWLFVQSSFFVGGAFLILVLLLQSFCSYLVRLLVPGFSQASLESAVPMVSLGGGGGGAVGGPPPANPPPPLN
jgi:putative peptidoglycan lipid II flippase